MWISTVLIWRSDRVLRVQRGTSIDEGTAIEVVHTFDRQPMYIVRPHEMEGKMLMTEWFGMSDPTLS